MTDSNECGSTRLKPNNVIDGQKLVLGEAVTRLNLLSHNFIMRMYFRLGSHSYGRKKLLDNVIYQNIIWVELFPSLHKFVHRIPLSKPLAHPLQ